MDTADVVYYLFRAMYKSARLLAGGALVGSVLTATGFVLIQEQLRLTKETPTVKHHLFK